MVQYPPGLVVCQRIVVKGMVVGIQLLHQVNMRKPVGVELFGQKQDAQKRLAAEMAPIKQALRAHDDALVPDRGRGSLVIVSVEGAVLTMMIAGFQAMNSSVMTVTK